MIAQKTACDERTEEKVSARGRAASREEKGEEAEKLHRRVFRRMDWQVAILLIVMLFLSNLCLYLVCYGVSYASMVESLEERVNNIWEYLDDIIAPLNFDDIDSREDMDNPNYIAAKNAMESVRRISNLRYVYTAKRAADGSLIYMVDGLPETAEDFRYPGDLIEPEIQGELEKALSDKVVMPSKILKTDWGKIFVAYCPVHDGAGKVAGALGLEISAETEYDAFARMRLFVSLFVVGLCVLSAAVSVLVFRRISNPHFRDLSNTDLLTGLKNRNAFETDMHNINVRKIFRDYGVIVIDLNNLKSVNDTLGHDMGDQYIAKAASAIEFAAGDGVGYRCGGDEFVVLVRDEQNMRRCEERIAEAFEAYKADFSCPVSLAIGAARFDFALDEDLSDTEKRADAEMYKNKKEQKEQK